MHVEVYVFPYCLVWFFFCSSCKKILPTNKILASGSCVQIQHSIKTLNVLISLLNSRWKKKNVIGALILRKTNYLEGFKHNKCVKRIWKYYIFIASFAKKKTAEAAWCMVSHLHESNIDLLTSQLVKTSSCLSLITSSVILFE